MWRAVVGKSMRRRLTMAALAATLLTGASGCAIFGYAAQAVGEGPVKTRYPKEDSKSHGLQNESVAVMVWVDRSVRIDYQSLQLDIANEVQTKMLIAQKDGKKELKGATFPIEPRSIIRYQREHPEIEAEPITVVAPTFNVSRLIFIEINNFETRPNAQLELFRGQIDATIKVIEIDAAGNAKIAFQEEHAQVVVPKKSPPEGVPGSNDVKIYGALLKEFTTQVTWRFFEHWEEEP